MINYGYTSENDKTGKPWVDKVTVEYNQNGDCCQDSDIIQRIVFESVDGGAGPFIRISIPKDDNYDCGFWSIDTNGDELINLINDFNKKLNYKK